MWRIDWKAARVSLPPDGGTKWGCHSDELLVLQMWNSEEQCGLEISVGTFNIKKYRNCWNKLEWWKKKEKQGWFWVSLAS